MSHRLFLAMYSFQLKKRNTIDSEVISIDDFLSNSYPNVDNKFSEGFVQDLISIFEEKVYKNKQNTVGGMLTDKSLSVNERTIDLFLDGGITGIKQFLIDENGKKRELRKTDTVGLKFFARFWLPSRTNTGYLFIQKYGSLSIKSLFDSIINTIVVNKKHSLVQNRLVPTTTKTRMNSFIKSAYVKNVGIFSYKNPHSTGGPIAQSAELKLKNVSIKNVDNLNMKVILKMAEDHGLKIEGSNYYFKATYELKNEDYKEERTVSLDNTDETINIVPAIVVPSDCINSDNHPIFEKMKLLTNQEIEQLKKEAKKR